MSFSSTCALVFNDEDVAQTVYEQMQEIVDDHKYLKDSHCDGGVGTPVYNCDLVGSGNVVEFDSGGYGTYNLEDIRLSAREFGAFVGWVQLITPCQSDDTYVVIQGDALYDEDNSTQYDFYDQCIPTEDWPDYPQQSDFQMMEDDEVVDDEETYETAVDEFNDARYEKLQEDYKEAIEAFLESCDCGSTDDVAF